MIRTIKYQYIIPISSVMLPSEHPEYRRVYILHLGQPGLALLLASSEGTGQSELRGNPVDAMGRVQILNHHHLVAGGEPLAGSDDGPGEEEFPDLIIRLEYIKDQENNSLCTI